MCTMKKRVFLLIGLLFINYVVAVSLDDVDLNKDNKIDINDLILITNNFGSTNSNYDIKQDGIINLFDLILVAKNFGKTYQCYDTVCITEVLDIAPVWSGHPVGFDFITYGNQQFVAFYDKDQNMMIASRNLDSDQWVFKKLPTKIGWDSHNYVEIAIDDDNQIHLSGNMHVDPLIYFKTTRPLDITSFQQISEMVGIDEEKVTYPTFLRGAKNEFLFTYRYGQSGSGVNYYNIYNYDTKTWSRLMDKPLFGFEEADIIFEFGFLDNMLPITGDWDNDGIDTIGLYDQKEGTFYLKNENIAGNADIVFRYGPQNSNWLPIAGDWNNNNIDTIGLYDQESGTFYLKNDNSVGVADISFRFGIQNSNWLPIAGD